MRSRKIVLVNTFTREITKGYWVVPLITYNYIRQFKLQSELTENERRFMETIKQIINKIERDGTKKDNPSKQVWKSNLKSKTDSPTTTISIYFEEIKCT